MGPSASTSTITNAIATGCARWRERSIPTLEALLRLDGDDEQRVAVNRFDDATLVERRPLPQLTRDESHPRIAEMEQVRATDALEREHARALLHRSARADRKVELRRA